jgi:hypothetical protein
LSPYVGREGEIESLVELRTAINLHTLCQANRQPERSRAALEAACQALKQGGFESEDLQEARTLLALSH